MKPDHLSESDYAKYLAKARASGEAEPGMSSMLTMMPQILDVMAAGHWLHDQAVADGATPEETENLCFAHGQACFPRREPWATAQSMIQRWREGRAPKAGAAFGEELLTGDVADLPKGGFRITKD